MKEFLIHTAASPASRVGRLQVIEGFGKRSVGETAARVDVDDGRCKAANNRTGVDDDAALSIAAASGGGQPAATADSEVS